MFSNVWPCFLLPAWHHLLNDFPCILHWSCFPRPCLISGLCILFSLDPLYPLCPSLDSIYIFLSYCGSPLRQMLHVLIHSIGRFVFSSSCCLHQQSLWNGKTFALKRSMHWCWRCRWNDADLKVVSVDYRHGMGKRGESFPVLPSTPGPSSLPLPKMSQITKID